MTTQPQEFEMLAPSEALQNATREIVAAEVDIAISTAHRFPRSLANFQKRAKDMVSIDEETAESCIYARPVGKGDDGKQKIAEGLSIRMAEIVAACYGNIRYGSQLVEQTDRRVVARGVAHDLEMNVSASSECVEATVKRNGQPYSEGQRNVVAKAALSKARRDALFMVVPRALCKGIEQEARKIITGATKPLSQRVGGVEAWLAKTAIDPARVWAVLEVAGPAELGNEHLITLTGLRTAIKEGDITIDEAFPSLEAPKEPVKFTPPAPKEKNPEPAPERQPEPVKSDGPSIHDELKVAMDSDSVTSEQLVTLLKAAGKLRKNGTFLTIHDIPAGIVGDVLKGWTDVLEQIRGGAQ